MKRVLIVGASSLVGANLAVALREDHCVYGTYNANFFHLRQVPMFHVDLLKEKALFDVILRVRPEIVIYCAAIRDEATCSQNALHTLTLNAEAAADIALCLRPLGARLIYFSTSKVFSGTKGNYSEEDAPDPNSSYGAAKFRAEELLMEFENVTTLRLGTLFGFGPRLQDGLLYRLLHQLWSGKEGRFISDEHRTFQSVSDVVDACKRLIHAESGAPGLYHCPGGGKATYFDFARMVARIMGLASGSIHPIPGASLVAPFNNPEIRGRDTSLSTEKFIRALGPVGSDLETSLESLKNQLFTGSI